ncbi:hypothetical protein HanHA300_Chr16g0624671 [Helianthus annuus]|nr:hypothetical protein HanHA300_Chr16g0624671 [Helianthus annuus]KAJ0486945.1 hypothetical protein HanHA89_Chr14g0585131 [Helianthus annuus]KAJ0648142.1 hypothetical protein HanLR1_Chr15g0569551 [Helianthus annuus]
MRYNEKVSPRNVRSDGKLGCKELTEQKVVRVMRIIKEQRSRIESLVRLYGNVDVYNVVNISYVST